MMRAFVDLLRRRSAAARVQRSFRRRSSDHQPKHGWIIVLAIVFGVAAFDWTVKLLVATFVPVGGLVEVWPGRVAVWHVRNPEMVLGLWGNLALETRQVIAATGGVLAVLLLYEIVTRGHRLPPHRQPWAWLFVGMAFGGMLGNLGERLLHWGVTDYLSFAWGAVWLPPANVADLALFLSIPLAIPVIVFELQARLQRRTRADRAENAADRRVPAGSKRSAPSSPSSVAS